MLAMIISLSRSPSILSTFYTSFPFDEAVTNDEIVVTAIAITVVFSLLFITGLIGHCFVLGFTSCRKSFQFLYAYVILSNLTVAQLLFVITCLPAIAYILLMGLVTSEWLFGDIACRLVPFTTVFLLGVTTFSFFAFAIDRFHKARFVHRGYDRTDDSSLHNFCKMLVLWIGALLLASPEVLMTRTTEVALPAQPGTNMTLLRDFTNLSSDIVVLTKSEYNLYRETGSVNMAEDFDSNNNTSTKYFVRYEICEVASAWNESYPRLVGVFMENYAYFRDWWMLVFYFFLPVSFALLFALLVSRRLSQATQNNNDSSAFYTGSYYVTRDLDGGTLTSQRDIERASLMDVGLHKKNVSHHPHMNDATYVQRGGYSLERQVSHNQFFRRLSPVMSTEDLEDASPTVVVSNGSLRTIDSSRRFADFSPQSPVSPTFTTNGVSLLSLAMSNTPGYGGGTLGTASLPPHGHRRSIKRRSSKQTLGKVAHERELNWVLVSLVFTFVLTQLPLRVVSILHNQTELLTLINPKYVDLIINLCQYLFVSTFVINPVILCLCYKSYRKYLARTCCRC